MTEAKRKAKLLLLQQNKTFADLAKDSDLALATVHNVLDGHKSSKKSKQAITNALGAQVFDDVFVTERHHTFGQGCVIGLYGAEGAPDIDLAKQFEKEFKGYVRRCGCEITFLKPTPAVLNFPKRRDEVSTQSKKGRKKKPHASLSANNPDTKK